MLWICVVLDMVFIGAQALFALTTVTGAPVSLGLDGQVSVLSDACAGCPNTSALQRFHSPFRSRP